MALFGEMRRYADAIASIESGGRYGVVGRQHPTLGRPLGRYQIMEANLPSWLRLSGLPQMSPDDFLASPQAQDTVFETVFGDYVRRFGPAGAAQAWFAGPGSIGAAGAGARQDSLGTSVASYVTRFRAALANPPALASDSRPAPADKAGRGWRLS